MSWVGVTKCHGWGDKMSRVGVTKCPGSHLLYNRVLFFTEFSYQRKPFQKKTGKE